MRFRRSALLAAVVTGSIFLANPGSHAGTATPTPAGLPLYQFVNSGVGPLPWNAVSLESAIQNTTMLGGPHAASDATEGVIAYRTSTGDLALYTQPTGAPSSTNPSTNSTTPSWQDVSTGHGLPSPAADPIPFFDPSGNAELLYVDERGHVILASPNSPITPNWARLHRGQPWLPWVATDLSALTGVSAANGLPSIQVEGTSAVVAYRTGTNGLEALTLAWSSTDPVPIYAGDGATVSTAALAAQSVTSTAVKSTTTKPATSSTTTTTLKTGTTTSTSTTTTTVAPTTTTTVAPSVVGVASDPVVIPAAAPTVAVLASNGHLEEFTATTSSLATWSLEDVSALTASAPLAGTLSVAASPSQVAIAALSSTGGVELFSSQAVTPVTWSLQNVTASTPSAPPLDGQLALNVNGAQITIAGQAANWGDLFVLTNTIGTSWSATDVSVTAGSSARTVGAAVAGLDVGSSLTLYAAGVSSPPKQGVGVYAIPTGDWGPAITNGWPIISETGGLGTQAAPWVGFTTAKSVATSPDFLLGQAIYNAHQRVTWLSFWTVSGPMAKEVRNATTYYNHGFAAGAWVATQIDSYRSLGVGLKPDWVIFDPEGYPDNHSGLDAPGGSNNATLALYATYWQAMLKGWQQGLASVDPSLNAGVYASQSEYRNYGLSTVAMPVFMAVAFGNGGPIPVAGASGSNVRGYIAFSATCTPKTTLKQEEQTLLNPPWSGQFNTLQFNAGVYCPPA